MHVRLQCKANADRFARGPLAKNRQHTHPGEPSRECTATAAPRVDSRTAELPKKRN
jgi:hypothetical protein